MLHSSENPANDLTSEGTSEISRAMLYADYKPLPFLHLHGGEKIKHINGVGQDSRNYFMLLERAFHILWVLLS